MRPLFLIPARMASTRLPGKPLADIAGVPMIVQVCRRVEEAQLGPVVVAAAESEIAEAVQAAGFEAVLTPPGLPSGTDRIWHALQQVDPEGEHDTIINVQGDLPTLDPEVLRAILAPLKNHPNAEITTAAARITELAEHTNPHVVKAVVAWEEGSTPRQGRALYFTRATAPSGEESPRYHHIGVYAYRRTTLERFVALPPSPLEQQERLEQLRALEAGIPIQVVETEDIPLGVDTPEDLEKARGALL